MSGPSEISTLSDKPESLLVYVERLRQQAEDFRRTVEDEARVLAGVLTDHRIGHGPDSGP
jgi:hypothetical protein